MFLVFSLFIIIGEKTPLFTYRSDTILGCASLQNLALIHSFNINKFQSTLILVNLVSGERQTVHIDELGNYPLICLASSKQEKLFYILCNAGNKVGQVFAFNPYSGQTHTFTLKQFKSWDMKNDINYVTSIGDHILFGYSTPENDFCISQFNGRQKSIKPLHMKSANVAPPKQNHLVYFIFHEKLICYNRKTGEILLIPEDGDPESIYHPVHMQDAYSFLKTNSSYMDIISYFFIVPTKISFYYNKYSIEKTNQNKRNNVIRTVLCYEPDLHRIYFSDTLDLAIFQDRTLHQNIKSHILSIQLHDTEPR